MLPAFGLYTHIQANRRRSVLLLAGLFLLAYLMAYAVALLGAAYATPEAALDALLGEAWGWFLLAAPFATMAAGLWIVAATALNRWIVDLVTGSDVAGTAEHAALHAALEALCISRGMAVPQLRIMETPAVNAFASGLDSDQYAITLTRGLLDTLDAAELEAVLAHELTHIRNEDVRLMVIAGVIAGAVSFLAEMIFRLLSDDSGSSGWFRSKGKDDGKGKAGALAAVAIALALIAVAWFLSQVIRYSLSRSREFLADAGAVELTKNPDAMISALLKIEGRGELPRVPSGIMEMCVDNPRSGFADLFATHPSIAERVEALERYAGGRRPVAEPPALAEAGPWSAAVGAA